VIDSHCHLAGDEFASDLDAVAGRARAAGVHSVLCIIGAEDEAERARVAAVRQAWPGAYFATGVHPHRAGAFAGRLDAVTETVSRAVSETEACGIGEIGLDYHYDFSPRDVQQEVFRAQVRLAREYSLPVIIHTREATEDTFRILREEGAGGISGVFHCFTGDVGMAEDALGLGFYLSFAGIITFPKAEALREAAGVTPLDRVLSETDAPYLAPVPHRGKRNEPAFVVRVVECLAGLYGVERRELEPRIAANFHQLFGLAR
jgi:TatD DNase family protein